MKTIVCIFILSIALTSCSIESQTPRDQPDTLRLITTTSVNDSGLMEYLRPYLLEQTNLSIDVVSLGSGAALEAGRRGDADVLLVHSPQDEMTFIQEGYGIKRSTFMHNYFVIVGPQSDPAGLKGLQATDAFKQLISTQQPFISRGDNSGTHSKEKGLWSLVDVDVEKMTESYPNYTSSGQGMANTLLMASELQAYTLTDLASYLFLKQRLDLDVIVDQSDELRNDYSLIRINPDVVNNVQVELAERFEAWMLQASTLKLIASYGVDTYGEALFIPNE